MLGWHLQPRAPAAPRTQGQRCSPAGGARQRAGSSRLREALMADCAKHSMAALSQVHSRCSQGSLDSAQTRAEPLETPRGQADAELPACPPNPAPLPVSSSPHALLHHTQPPATHGLRFKRLPLSASPSRAPLALPWVTRVACCPSPRLCPAGRPFSQVTPSPRLSVFRPNSKSKPWIPDLLLRPPFWLHPQTPGPQPWGPGAISFTRPASPAAPRLSPPLTFLLQQVPHPASPAFL